VVLIHVGQRKYGFGIFGTGYFYLFFFIYIIKVHDFTGLKFLDYMI